ncbi:hypothetical protein CLV78_103379 [Aliiruegeria haliotis]|uniref:CENP-V/GFA domain-containing protein n=1 Tax=Aliiruegeria haliotis TaxID=1280846 RepID=A0A2T0RTN6_9RHOB|nr:GFA family protein [Aliiruegeria haliotis]PRY24512.1 hypothetical protein CLV78_103379 [Aliiruegeria haliotis]
MKGRCMCGAVQVEATPETQELHACHCEMCRRWTGSAFVEIDVADGDLSWSGPVKTFTSSDWAERAFCAECGSTLWYRMTSPEHRGYSVSAGLFENAGGLSLSREIFIDCKPEGFAFAGERERLTEAEVLAAYAPEVAP